jgi:hypothetical protein
MAYVSLISEGNVCVLHAIYLDVLCSRSSTKDGMACLDDSMTRLLSCTKRRMA